VDPWVSNKGAAITSVRVLWGGGVEWGVAETLVNKARSICHLLFSGHLVASGCCLARPLRMLH
jgi:hypothetical protein